jgi:Ser/Thr protein kinase RdoA (MazF antagonist)
VSRHAPGLAPTLRASGELEGYRYLVEDWVRGRPLGSGRRLAEELMALLQPLARLHAGYGVQLRSASDLWPQFGPEWEVVRDVGLVGPEVAEALRDLLAQDRRLRVSWTHGDPAASNVLATAEGLTVIDWEHARERPVMFDGARLHLFAADPPRTVQSLVDAWGAAQGLDCYGPLEELALLHARFVCHAPSRIARMAGHPRSEVYARQVERQVERLAGVLDVAAR